MHPNNYHDPEEKTEDISLEKIDPEYVIQKLKSLLNYLQNKVSLNKNEKEY